MTSAPSDERAEALREAARAGWNACRKSIYAVCEDVVTENERHRDDIENPPRHHFGRGGMTAAKSIARGFNSMEADDDDNFTAALSALSQPATGGARPRCSICNGTGVTDKSFGMGTSPGECPVCSRSRPDGGETG